MIISVFKDEKKKSKRKRIEAEACIRCVHSIFVMFLAVTMDVLDINASAKCKHFFLFYGMYFLFELIIHKVQ